jgi:hypothetical protein
MHIQVIQIILAWKPNLHAPSIPTPEREREREVINYHYYYFSEQVRWNKKKRIFFGVNSRLCSYRSLNQLPLN